jgi:hypothetical protein
VDGAPDLSSYEGFVSTQLTVPPDEVQVGGTLSDCMGKLAKGDQLIIIAHGFREDGPPRKLGFIWQGTRYSGFGSGPGQYPVPAAFADLNHVTVTVGSCWSAADPDGAGGQPPVTESLLGAMSQNAGNKVEGFTGAATNNTIVDVGNPERNSAHQIQAARESLGAHQDYWRNRAPAGNKRNPPPATDEQKRAKRFVDSLFAGKDIPVTIRYSPVRDTRRDPFDPQSVFTVTALDDTSNCPEVNVIFVTSGLVPGVSPLSLLMIGAFLVVAAYRGLRDRATHPPRPPA